MKTAQLFRLEIVYKYTINHKHDRTKKNTEITPTYHKVKIGSQLKCFNFSLKIDLKNNLIVNFQVSQGRRGVGQMKGFKHTSRMQYLI